MSETFLTLLRVIQDKKPETASLQGALEKEILHMAILLVMREQRLLEKLIFKGGTCLRLCHQGRRFSEDLDFSGGDEFDPQWMDGLDSAVNDKMARLFGLAAGVRMAGGSEPGRSAYRWWVKVSIHRPNSQLRAQRIKIDVNPASPDENATMVAPATFPQADVLPYPTMDVVTRCYRPESIVAEKLVAFPYSVTRRENPRYRDLWDLYDFSTAAAKPTVKTMAAKHALAHGSRTEYLGALETTLDRLSEVVESQNCRHTLARFLPAPLANNTIHEPMFREALANKVGAMLKEVRSYVVEAAG